MPSSAPATATSAQIARLRMRALGLDRAGSTGAPGTPAEVVGHMLAMQAQDWPASRWAIGSRLPGSVERDVFDAYDAGEIVRSWPMRGTVHTVVAGDLHWMLELMGVRALGGVQRRWEFLGIDEQLLERGREVAVTLLKGGGRCTRAELTQAMTDAGLDLAGQRAYHAVWYLAQTGTLCMGPTRGREHELVLLDEWVRTPRRLSRDDALAELGRRYLASHGPATVDDLVHWTKLTKRDCRTAIEANADDLVELHRDGAALYAPRKLVESPRPRPGPALLALAAFDEHLLGYRDRVDVLDPRHAEQIVPGRNGVFRPTIVKDARVIGVWTKAQRTRRIVARVEQFSGPAPADSRRVLRALEAYGTFLGTEIELA